MPPQPTKTPRNSKERWLRVLMSINLMDRDHMNLAVLSCADMSPLLLFVSNLIVSWWVHSYFKLGFNGNWMPRRNRSYPQRWCNATESGIEPFYSTWELSTTQTFRTSHKQIQKCLFSDLRDARARRSKNEEHSHSHSWDRYQLIHTTLQHMSHDWNSSHLRFSDNMKKANAEVKGVARGLHCCKSKSRIKQAIKSINSHSTEKEKSPYFQNI